MYKAIIKILIVSYLLFVSSFTSKALQEDFDLNGKSSFLIENTSSDTAFINIENWYTIPLKVQKIDTFILKNNSFYTSLISQAKDYFNLKINNKAFKIFSKPGYTVQIIYHSEDNIDFSGSEKDVNEFLLKKGNYFQSTESDWMPRVRFTHNTDEFEEIITANDSITKLQQNFLIDNKMELPNWYFSFERKRLNYLNAYWKLNSLMYRKRMLNKSDSLGPQFLELTINDLSINDSDMLGNKRYMNFLSDFIGYKSDPMYENKMPSNTEEWIVFYEHSIDVINQLLTAEVKDTYLTFTLLNIIKRRRYIFNTKWIENIEGEELKKLVLQKYEANPILPKGSQLPFFLLTDSDGNRIKSNDFKGRILLINFWATWCKPCIKEFPYENKLVERYDDQELSVVNICMYSDKKTWKKYIQKYQLKSINLFAENSWTSKIEKDFGIRGIPHSVLVDENGKVFQNKCARPSEDISKEIDKLLIKDY